MREKERRMERERRRDKRDEECNKGLDKVG